MQQHTALTLTALDPHVPISSRAQAQGDLLVLPVAAGTFIDWAEIPSKGVQLMQRASSANSHWLVRAPLATGVRWAACAPPGNTVAMLLVPDAELVWLVHTEEHSVIGIGPGEYRIQRKRQQGYSVHTDYDPSLYLPTYVED